MSKCEMKWCISGRRRATVRVNENLEDASFNTGICRQCANALGLRNGQDLPDAVTVRRLLTNAKRKGK